MTVSTDTFEGYTITLSGGTETYLGTGTSDEALGIRWEVSSLDLDQTGGEATIFYERPNITQQPTTYRKTVVKISAGDTPLFYGEVIDQSVSHETVTLNCESFVKRINDFPIYGVISETSGSSDNFNSQAFAVYGEQTKNDKIITGQDWRDLDNRTASGDDEGPDPWYMSDIAANSLTYLRRTQIDGTSYANHIDLDDVMSTIVVWEALLDTQSPRYGITPKSGIADVIQEAAHEQAERAVWYIDDSGDDWTFKLKFVDQTDTKTLDMNEASASQTVDNLPYSIDVSYDFNSPTKMICFSGKAYIQTMFEIDPDSATQIFEENTDNGYGSTSRSKLVAYSDGSRDGERSMIDAGLKIDNLPPSAKVLTQSGINPHIVNLEDEDFDNREIKFADDFDVYVKFDERAIDSSYELSDGYILYGSEEWKKAEVHQKNDAISKFEDFDIAVSSDGLRVEIESPVDEVAFIQESGLRFFKGSVKSIVIPVTIEVPHRMTALATRTDSTSVATTGEAVNSWDYITGAVTSQITSDPEEHTIETVVLDELRPVYQIADIEEYDDTDGTITRRSLTSGFLPNSTDLNTELVDRAKDELQRAILSDGTTMTISMPLECYLALGTTYPKEIGDIVDEVTGDIQHGLTRPLSLESISLSNTDATLNFS